MISYGTLALWSVSESYSLKNMQKGFSGWKVLVICQVKGVRKRLQAGVICFDGSDEEPGRLGSVSSPPFLSGFLEMHAS